MERSTSRGPLDDVNEIQDYPDIPIEQSETGEAPVQVAQADSSPVDETKVTLTFTATPGGRIELPEGATVDQVIKVGADIYFVQANGDLIKIVGGATTPVTLVIGGVEIPAEALTAALEGAEEGVPTAGPQVGGPSQSSGQTFEDPIGDIGPPEDLVDLLGPEQLQFFVPVFDRREEPFNLEEEEVASIPPPSIGNPQTGAVEEDDLGNNIVQILSLQSVNGPSEPKTGNDLDGSAPFALMFTGDLDVDFGSNPGTITFPPGLDGAQLQNSSGDPLTSNDLPVFLSLQDPQTLIGFTDGAGGTPGVYDSGIDHDIFIVTLDSAGTGSYKITVLCNLDHFTPVHNGQDGDTDGNDGDGFPTPGDEELIGLTFPFTATNGGGSAEGVFNVLWQDDMPIIGNGDNGNGEYEEYSEKEWEEISNPLVDEDPNLPDGLSGGPGDDIGGLIATGDLNILWGADHGNSNNPEATYGDRMIVMTSLVVTDEAGNTLLDVGFTMTDPSTYTITENLNDLKALVPLDPSKPDEFSQVDIEIVITTDANLQNVLQGIAVDSNGVPILDGGGDPIVVFEVTTDDSGSGSFSYELLRPLVHQFTDPDLLNNGPETAYEDNLLFTFGFNAKDSDLDTVSGQFEVEVDDDSPAFDESGGLFVTDMITHDETEGLQTVLDGFNPTSTEDDNDNDVLFSSLPQEVQDAFGADTSSGIANKGSDGDVSPDDSGPNTAGAIGYARSGGALVDFFGVEFGADGPFGGTTDPGSGAVTYALTLDGATDPVATSLETTEGADIFLFLENGLIVGRYDGDDAGTDVTNDGTDPAAFALAIDPDTGELFSVQYVSLFNNSPGDGTGGTHDEPVSLAFDSQENPVPLFAEVTFKDGDEDALVDSVRIGSAVKFEDDGPKVMVEMSEEMFDKLNLDETIGEDRYNTGETPQDDNGDLDDDVTGSLAFSELGITPLGMLMTGEGDVDGLFNVTAMFGSDGPAEQDSLTKDFSIVLKGTDGEPVDQGEGVVTNLFATQPAPGGNPDGDNDGSNGDFTPYADAQIYLFQEMIGSETVIVGRVGNGQDDDTNPIAFIVYLTGTGTGDPADVKMTVEQVLAIDHDASLFDGTGAEDPSVFDEEVMLMIAEQGLHSDSGINIVLNVEATDGDFDTAEGMAMVNVTGKVSFDDDGPVISTTDAMVGHDETDGIQSDDPNKNDTSASLPAALAAALPGVFGGTPPDPIGAAQGDSGQVTGDPGSDGLKNIAFTDENGDLFDGDDSGLNRSEDDADILLTTDATNNNVLVGHTAGGEVVFVAYFDPDDGTFWLVQYGAIANSIPGDNIDPAGSHDERDDTTASIRLTVTDNDDDSATSDTDIVLKFFDDGPTLIPDGDINFRDLTIDEEGLSTTSGMPPAPFDGNPGESYPAPNDDDAASILANGQAQLGIDWGADDGNTDLGGVGDRMVFFTNADVAVAELTAPDVLSSGGQEVFFTLLDDMTLVGYVGDEVADEPTATDDANVVFVVTVGDTGTGFFAYTQKKPFDHPIGDNLATAANESIEDDLTLTFNFTAKDSDLDTIDGQFTVIADDDAPIFTTDPDEVLYQADMVTHDETEGLQDGTDPDTGGDGNDDDVLFSSLPQAVQDAFGADTSSGVANKGSDGDVSPDDSGPNTAGAIGYARSGGALVGFNSGNVSFGADGPQGGSLASATMYLASLGTPDGNGLVDSGVDTTEGLDVYLFIENGVIVGRVDVDNDQTDVQSGPAAFAVYIDSATGEAFTAHYLSLFHPDSPNNFDESISLNTNAIQITVKFTDNDGDTIFTDPLGVGNLIKFEDDGPQITVSVDDSAVNALMIGLDESIVDPQTSPEDEPGDFTAGSDDIAVVDGGITQVDGTNPIGMQMTSSGDISGLFDFTTDAGADGEKDREDTYKLTLTDADGNAVDADPGTFLVANGVATTLEVTDFAADGNPDLNSGNPYADRVIYLFLVSDAEIQGRIDADGDGTADDIAFTVELDLTTFGTEDPKLIVSQIFAIDHPDSPDNFDEQEILGIAGMDVDPAAGIGVTLQSKLIDNDDDEALSNEATANITGAVKFEDDGPAEISISVNQDQLGSFMIGLDESIVDPQTSPEDEPGDFTAGSDDIAVVDGGITQVDGTNPIGMQMTSSGDISGLFDFTTDAGADGEKDREDTYKLTLTDADGNAVDADPGTFLVANGVATTLEVTDFAADGNPDLNSGNPYADRVIYLFLVSDAEIQGRIDADGDGTADDIAFTVELDLTTFGTEDPKLIVSQIFALDHDPDNNDFDSQLVLGIAGMDVDPAAGIGVTAQSTLIDGDNDELDSSEVTANITSAIKFEDDGPLLLDGQMVMGVVEEEHLDNFDPNYVGPGVEGSTGNEDEDDVNDLDDDVDPNFDVTTDMFTGNAGNGQSLAALVDFGTDGGKFVAKDVTGTDAAVVKDSNGDTVTSRGFDVSFTDFDDTVAGQTTLTATSSDGRTIFTLTIFENGDWQLDLEDQIDHHPLPIAADDAEDIRTLDLGAVVNAVDGDNDTIMLAAGTFLVKVIDDIPVDFFPKEAFVLNADNAMSVLDLEFAEAVGADEPGNVVFSLTDGEIATDNGNTLTFEGDTIFLFGDGTTTLVGSTDENFDIGSFDPNNPDASVIFTVVLDPANDTYKVTVLQAEISNGVGFSETDIESGVSGGNTSFVGIGANDPNNNGGNVDILLSNPDGLTVNTSQGRIGLGNGQSIDDNEVLCMEFFVNLDTTDDGAVDDPAGGGFFFDDRFTTTSFEQVVNRINGQGTASLAVAAILVGGTNPDITRVVVRDENGGIVFDGTADGTQGGITVSSLTGTDNTVEIVGIEEDWSYFIETDGDMNKVQVTGFDSDNSTANNDDDTPFTLGAFTLGGEPFEPFSVETDVVGTDADGDSVTSSLEVTFLPADSGDNFVGTENDDLALNGNANDNIIAGLGGDDVISGLAGNDTIFGGNGDDTIDGGSDNDTIDGGMGQDTLTGGTGNDTFVLANVDIFDIITDYDFDNSDGNGTDSIDLTALFNLSTVTPVNAGELAGFVDYDNTTGDLFVDTAGGSVDPSATGTQVANIQTMPTNITIVVDDGGGNTSSEVV